MRLTRSALRRTLCRQSINWRSTLRLDASTQLSTRLPMSNWRRCLSFARKVISLNLGVFNLFPIPILDGGVIVMLLIESALRRDISITIKERIYQAAFVFL